MPVPATFPTVEIANVAKQGRLGILLVLVEKLVFPSFNPLQCSPHRVSLLLELNDVMGSNHMVLSSASYFGTASTLSFLDLAPTRVLWYARAIQ